MYLLATLNFFMLSNFFTKTNKNMSTVDLKNCQKIRTMIYFISGPTSVPPFRPPYPFMDPSAWKVV